MREGLGNEVRVQHIFECIDEIETAIKGITFTNFESNHVLRIAVVKWLEIIGEAAHHISDEVKNKNSQISWRDLIGINYNVIWNTATIYLQDLKVKLGSLELVKE